MRRPSILQDAAPDPVAARCLAFALERGEALAAAVDLAVGALALPAERVGLLLAGSTGIVRPLARADLWRAARQLALEVPAGAPRFFPVLVTLPTEQGTREAAVCWLGPLPASDLRRAS